MLERENTTGPAVREDRQGRPGPGRSPEADAKTVYLCLGQIRAMAAAVKSGCLDIPDSRSLLDAVVAMATTAAETQFDVMRSLSMEESRRERQRSRLFAAVDAAETVAGMLDLIREPIEAIDRKSTGLDALGFDSESGSLPVAVIHRATGSIERNAAIVFDYLQKTREILDTVVDTAIKERTYEA